MKKFRVIDYFDSDENATDGVCCHCVCCHCGKLKIGDRIKFGSYPKEFYSDKKEPIEWRVLAVENGKALIISEYGLDSKEYNEGFRSFFTPWRKCTLREWLNSEFLNSAFENIEKDMILPVHIKKDNTLVFKDKGDKVFILSAEEAEQYFKNDEDRKCVHTPYKCSNNEWWTRTVGRLGGVVYVDKYGHLSYFGTGANSDFTMVRPALWIKIDTNNMFCDKNTLGNIFDNAINIAVLETVKKMKDDKGISVSYEAVEEALYKYIRGKENADLRAGLKIKE